MKGKTEQFNIVIVGTGGQGLLTLLQILAEAALADGYDVKTSELHGLSQRGGSVEVHLRFGRKIYSPLVPQASADLILALELQESLKAGYFARAKTTFLINDYLVPIPLQRPLPKNKILKTLRAWANNILLVPAADTCQKELGSTVVAGVYLLAFASLKKIIPIKPNSILQAIKKVVPQKYLELNRKAFNIMRSKTRR